MLRALLVRPVSIVVASAMLVTLGAASLWRLPVSLLPSLERPQLIVVVEDADRSRHDLVLRVVEPLERRLLEIEGVLTTRSWVGDGVARIVADTEWQTDVDRVRIDAERRLAEVSSLDLDVLSITTATGDREPIVELAVGGGGSASERTRFVERIVVPELAALPGAGLVRRTGGAERRVVVRPLAAALAARGLTAADVLHRLEAVGRVRPLGAVREGAALRPAVARLSVASLAELGELRLGGAGVALRDVAQIGIEEIADEGVYRAGGRDAVAVEVFRAPGANAIALARAVRRATERSSRQAPSGLDVELVRDGSQEVIASLRELAVAALAGLLLGALVLRLMLGRWRPTLTLIAVVPASIVAAFGAFLLWGIALDVVSLAGLALALGMLVDNAIVVLEAIESSDDADPVGAGTTSVAGALAASFWTTAAVFVPLLYLEGLARAFFGVQAFAITSSLLISLALSVTLTPVLVGWLRRRRGAAARPGGRGRELYLRLLERTLSRPWIFAGGVLVLAAAITAGGALLLGRELVPAGSGSRIEVAFALRADLDAAAQARALERIGSVIRRTLAETSESATRDAATADPAAGGSATLRDVRYRELRLDDPAEGESAAGERAGRARIDLPEQSEPMVARVARRLERALAALPDVAASATVERAVFARALLRANAHYEIEASAATPERARALGRRLAERLAAGGIDAAPVEDRRRQRSLIVTWDRQRLAALGAPAATLESGTRAALGRVLAGRTEIEQVEPEILLEQTVAPDLDQLPILALGEDAAPAGSRFGPRVATLAGAADLATSTAEATWQRRNGRPAATLALAGARAGSSRTLEAALGDLALAPDERWRPAGLGHELDRSFRQLRLALTLAVVLVFLTIAALYESFTLPIAVMATVPVATAGALGALALTGQTLNVMSLVGLILLIGIVVNNSIVLLHRLAQLRAEAALRSTIDVRSLRELAAEAAASRYRPIVMTTLTTVIAMAPLALLGGSGVELRRALAITVAGGLSAGVLASLFVVPALYVALERAFGGTTPEQDPENRACGAD